MLHDQEVTRDDIIGWKKAYENVYYFVVGANEYIFRLLTRHEYTHVAGVYEASAETAEEIVIEWCLLYPRLEPGAIDEFYAGDVAELARNICEQSGFFNSEKLISDLDERRSKNGLVGHQITIMLCKAFPGLRPEDVDKLDYYKLLNYIALAESILDATLKLEKPQDDKLDFKRDNSELASGGKSRNGGARFSKSGRRLR